MSHRLQVFGLLLCDVAIVTTVAIATVTSWMLVT